MSVPLEDVVVISSFGVPLPDQNGQTRDEWVENRVQTDFRDSLDPHLENLMTFSNDIKSMDDVNQREVLLVQQQSPHIDSTSTHRMTCEVRVIFGDISITLPMMIGSGCLEELTLDLEDIHTLKMTPIGTRQVRYAHGFTCSAEVYEDVIVQLTLSDNSVVETSVTPVLLQRTPNPNVVGLPIPERILGYPALEKLNLKLDFRNKRLIK